MISFNHRGDFRKTERFLKKSLGRDYIKVLDRYGRQGVDELMKATPKDTGETGSSWYYQIIQNQTRGTVSVVWKNSNVIKGINIAIILQYGHGTRGGGWVEGRDFINPALRPIFDKMADAAWKEVLKV